MAEGNVTAKAMKPPDPEEFLAQLHEDFRNQAERLQREADTAEDAMLQARARCSAMWAAANGVREAMDVFQNQMAKAHEARTGREDRDEVKVPQEYDSRAHERRYP